MVQTRNHFTWLEKCVKEWGQEQAQQWSYGIYDVLIAKVMIYPDVFFIFLEDNAKVTQGTKSEITPTKIIKGEEPNL